MRSYDKNSIYICCIKNYLKYSDRKFDTRKGFIYNSNYFSAFLKINENNFFDLSTGEYYKKNEEPNIKIIFKLNIKSNYDNVSEIKIRKEAKKYYNDLYNTKLHINL